MVFGIDTQIANSEQNDLSGEDLLKITEGQTKVVPYHNLNQFESIEELLKDFGSVILLYETRKDFGHYTALLYDKNGVLEFFDSYGLKPDEELKYAEYNLEEGIPYLTKLLNNYNKPIIYNQSKLQKFIRDVNTCGRWTSLRIRFRNIYNLKDFQELFSRTKHFNGDFFVSALTYLYTM